MCNNIAEVSNTAFGKSDLDAITVHWDMVYALAGKEQVERLVTLIPYERIENYWQSPLSLQVPKMTKLMQYMNFQTTGNCLVKFKHSLLILQLLILDVFKAPLFF